MDRRDFIKSVTALLIAEGVTQGLPQPETKTGLQELVEQLAWKVRENAEKVEEVLSSAWIAPTGRIWCVSNLGNVAWSDDYCMTWTEHKGPPKLEAGRTLEGVPMFRGGEAGTLLVTSTIDSNPYGGMRTKVYKVVCRQPDGELVSTIVWYDGWQIRYTPGEWTEAKNGTGLFVFRTLETARAFMDKRRNNEQIWLAEAEGVRLPPELSIPSTNPAVWIDYWHAGPEALSAEQLICPPYGTLMANRVRLIERVR